MKKQILVCLTLLAVVGAAHAATITQNFNTGQITPGTGSDTFSVFTVDKFDTSLGALTSITISISLDSWDGYYAVQNITVPSASVNGNLQQGISAWITGMHVPNTMDTTLFAGEARTYILPANGNEDGISGPDYDNRNQTGPNIGTVDSDYFILYQGAGTYQITFYSAQGSSHTANGAVRGSFESSMSQGFLTVTYEYVPEPTSMALLALGCAAIGLRRRVAKRV